MRTIESEFVFALTNTGSESALKLEVESMGLGWRLSYQRSGFVTFKKASRNGFFSLGTIAHPLACARRLCLSIGKSDTREDAENRIKLHPAYCGGAIHHVQLVKRKMERMPGGLRDRPEAGECIGTVVELRPQEYWAGLHLHSPYFSPDPGGDSSIVMPGESPSRAWLKLEEAVRFFDLELSPKDIVVELGCAPGGVVLALLQRGISVIGVDPAQMAPVVLESAVLERRYAPLDRAWFYHCCKPAALAGKRDLGKGVTWFMSDMNQSPAVVLKECERFCKMSPTIRGVLITLKLTEMSQVVEKQKWFDRLLAMGFTTIRLQQLTVHHKEFALLALW
ncbi:MAG: SAM-dependent methyltransferase [Luteolibacter sp.]